jgi:hypothetical protein
MHKPTLVVLALALASTVPAQTDAPVDPLSAARGRLLAALTKTAALADTGFEASWGADSKKKQDPMAFAFGPSPDGKAKGSWHRGLLHCAFDGDTGDELLVAGRQVLAKDQARPWVPRAGRYADGNPVPFVPDLALLLATLARQELAVVHHEVGALDDRPVEIVTTTLNADQVAELVWTGAIPAALTEPAGFGRMQIVMGGAMGGQGGRAPATPPTSTVDVAIALDPATALVHDVHLRAWTRQDAGMAAVQRVFVARGGAVQVAGGADDEEDDEEEQVDEATAEAGKAAPLQFAHCLPLRPRKKTAVMDYRVRLRDHGTHAAPALDAATQKLLAR